jgi:hypothetical protein
MSSYRATLAANERWALPLQSPNFYWVLSGPRDLECAIDGETYFESPPGTGVPASAGFTFQRLTFRSATGGAVVIQAGRGAFDDRRLSLGNDLPIPTRPVDPVVVPVLQWGMYTGAANGHALFGTSLTAVANGGVTMTPAAWDTQSLLAGTENGIALAAGSAAGYDHGAPLIAAQVENGAGYHFGRVYDLTTGAAALEELEINPFQLSQGFDGLADAFRSLVPGRDYWLALALSELEIAEVQDVEPAAKTIPLPTGSSVIDITEVCWGWDGNDFTLMGSSRGRGLKIDCRGRRWRYMYPILGFTAHAAALLQAESYFFGLSWQVFARLRGTV